MEFNELLPIVTLLTEQEKRLSDKIDRVHDDVKDTNNKVGLINGRLRKAEQNISSIQTNCENRVVTCSLKQDLMDKRLDEIEPLNGIGKMMNWVIKNPKTSLGILLVLITGLQIVVLVAIKNEWITKLIEKFI